MFQSFLYTDNDSERLKQEPKRFFFYSFQQFQMEKQVIFYFCIFCQGCLRTAYIYRLLCTTHSLFCKIVFYSIIIDLTRCTDLNFCIIVRVIKKIKKIKNMSTQVPKQTQCHTNQIHQKYLRLQNSCFRRRIRARNGLLSTKG